MSDVENMGKKAYDWGKAHPEDVKKAFNWVKAHKGDLEADAKKVAGEAKKVAGKAE